MKDFQLNLDIFMRKFRLKTVFLDRSGTGSSQTPVDIVVFKYSGVKLDRFSSLAITFNGVEQVRNIEFSAKLSFDLLSKRWKLAGTWKGWPVEESFDSFLSIFPFIRELAVKN